MTHGPTHIKMSDHVTAKHLSLTPCYCQTPFINTSICLHILKYNIQVVYIYCIFSTTTTTKLTYGGL